ncbi:MAG: DUF3298 and DUF4163 domain-containing protein [Butyrivibrio sp.]|nr:DUF3298 and DUF4163 domain-containing protein [Butyrivibrio sp.]
MRKNLGKEFRKGFACIIAASLVFSLYGCGKTADKEPEETEISGEDNSDNEDLNNENASGTAQTSPDKSEAETENGMEEDAIAMIINHPVSSKYGDVEKAYGHYPEIILSDTVAKAYPKLKAQVDSYNTSWKENIEETVAEYAVWAQEYTEDDEMEYSSEIDIQIVRCDDKMFSIVGNYMDYGGGAHPNHGTWTLNVDPATGKEYVISDVLNDTTDFPEIVREKLAENYPYIEEEVDSYYYGEGEAFQDMLDNNSYHWSLTEKGLSIFFSPYEIASYAAGYSDVNIGNDEYPSLIQDIFKVTESQNIESKVTLSEGDLIEVEPYEEPDDTVYIDTINNPGWDEYCKEDKTPEGTSFVSLTQTKADKSDWLDRDKWALEHGFQLASMPCYDENYSYYGSNPIEYSYMFNELLVYEASDGLLKYDLDLSVLCNGPDESQYRSSAITQYVSYAQIVDDILYATIMHNGYSSEEPYSNYMVAIDLNDKTLLWRSEPCVSNASNFKIVNDTIICGYGFTAEPDYIYLLNRYNGQKVGEIAVNSAPDQFEIVDGTLYVATYNTAYEFTINQ